MEIQGKPLVSSIAEKCRVCYTCVRECPAKAIRIESGQAQVVPERCIGCGNCVRVCSQNAKSVYDSTEETERILGGSRRTAAIVAPSFPVEFDEYSYGVFVGKLRKLGFTYVNEVAAGADLVAYEYKRLLEENPDKDYIATSCPAVVAYVEYYYPSLVEKLAPVVSPMVATARALRSIYGEDLRVVFIGPCISKKGEGVDSDIPDTIDAVLTFSELRSIFLRRGVDKENTPESDFDPPDAFKGRLFPVAGGLLETADIEENLLDGDVVATDGRENFVAAIKEFDKGALDTRLLEVLCCNGCIMGAGISKKYKPLFQRRSEVIEYVRERVSGIDKEDGLADLRGIDLSRTYRKKDRRIPVPKEEDIREVLNRMGKSVPEDELNCGACGYSTCRDHAVAILKGLAESEMCLPYSIEQLKTTVSQLEMSNNELASTQKALVQSEKLASMGQLAAGIAHEVNNPLGVVLMYSHLLLEGVDGKSEMGQDVKMIAEQADRCKRIVSGLLNFARQNKTVCNNTNITDLVKRSVKTFKFNDNIEIDVQSKTDAPYAEIDSDQISQSIVNLFTNAQDAMPEGGKITVSIEDDSDSVILRVSDTGKGIPEENREKIFDPFFTTKQIGMGTGLGLAVIYGIIKMHKGDIQVNSNTDPDKGSTGTEFIITLPKRNEQ